MTRGGLRGAVVVLALLCGCGGREAEPAKPPAGAAAPAAAAASPTVASAPPAGSQGSSTAPASADPDDDAPGTCGSETCAPDQFCEDLYKGHAADARGRPLDRKKCMPLPESCKAKPTCACVTKQVASTHCTDDGGRVNLNDYPVRR
jgi:hypothetical protein